MSAYVDRLQGALRRLRDFRLHLLNPTFANPEWGKASPRVLILRLSSFTDVERSTPHLFLATEIRGECPSAYVDMAFLPRKDDERILAEAGLPFILGTQSHFPVESFDLVLVSNSYLLELVNLPYLFSHSNVPLWASHRDGRWPPLILGGSNSSAAHSLVAENGDCMADALFFGEGEGAVAQLATELSLCPKAMRKTRLQEMALEIDGLWVPTNLESRQVHRARRGIAQTSTKPTSRPVLPGAEATTARLTITLGCACLCSFCFEGHDRRPFREIPVDTLVAQARALKRETGAATIELSSFNFNMHTELPELLVCLHRLFFRVNLMSQRVDILARTPGLLDLELAADKHSFTLGIEGISGRQRRFLHKSLVDAEIKGALRALHSRRTREVKLFYILTGGETAEDFTEFAGFVKWLKETRRRIEAPPRLVFSFGLLVRMPFTPLRYYALLLSETAWRALAGRAKSLCETNGFEFRLSTPWPEYAATQVLAVSHSSLAYFLVDLSVKGSVSSDSLPSGGQQMVDTWLREHGPQVQTEKQEDHLFAFNFLETMKSRKALYGQYRAARDGEARSYIARPVDSSGSGILPEKVRQLAQITSGKHKLLPSYWQVVFVAETAGLGTEWRDSWLMRRLLTLFPGQTDNVLSIRESLLAQSAALGAETAWFGRSVAAVTAWDQKEFEQAAHRIPELFVTPAVDFKPKTWTTLLVSLSLSASLFPDALERFAGFLNDSHAPVTIKRQGESFILVVPEKSARRKVVLAGMATRKAETVHLRLTLGAKARLGDFLDSFGTEARRSVVVEVSGVG
jgi:radical SAM superfamily enzyme YgiQ (UPF0313 family)